jgi:hypothetical protein
LRQSQRWRIAGYGVVVTGMGQVRMGKLQRLVYSSDGSTRQKMEIAMASTKPAAKKPAAKKPAAKKPAAKKTMKTRLKEIEKKVEKGVADLGKRFKREAPEVKAKVSKAGKAIAKKGKAVAKKAVELEKSVEQDLGKLKKKLAARTKSPAKKSPAKKSPAKKSPAKKAPAKKAPAKKAPAKKSPAKKAAAKKAPARKVAKKAA